MSSPPTHITSFANPFPLTEEGEGEGEGEGEEGEGEGGGMTRKLPPKLGHLFLTTFLSDYSACMVIPAIADVTMAAVCPGQDKCSLAIYLSGFQQAVIGVGTLFMLPLIGDLSDKYGRKSLLTLPMTLSILPFAILAYSMSRNFFYAYYVLKTLTAMISQGSVHCLSLAYVADNVPAEQRASAYGILSGVGTAAHFCGTFSARFLSPASTFQVATTAAIVATVYMRIFLPDVVVDESLTTPILSVDNAKMVATCSSQSPTRNDKIFKSKPSLDDMLTMLRSSATFTQAAIVAFFMGLSDSGLHASLQYYLKAEFHFNKDQFADMIMISGVSGTVSQLIVMPILAPLVGEGVMLSVALFFSCAHTFLIGVAWSSWVPYACFALSMFYILSQPCLRTIVSKQVGPCEQGKAQGCISGITSFAHVVSPFMFSPLSALFLSDHAPFDFPGFAIMCTGLAMMVAFVQSLMMRIPPPISEDRVENFNYAV